MTPTVSVILNCYNHEAYVAEAIESVLGQTYRDFELILIDNGSTDGTRAVLERYDDPRIRRLFHDENQLLSKRLNEGAAAAKGVFVAVLYSDDWMLPDKLERQVAMFRTLGPEYGVVYCPAIRFNQLTGQRWEYSSFGLSGTMMPAMLDRHQQGPIDMSSPLTRRACIVQYPWHNDLFADGEAIFLRIGMTWKFQFDPRPTVVLRDHGGNMGKVLGKNFAMFMEVLKRLEQHPNFEEAWRPALHRLAARTNGHFGWLMTRSSSGDMRWARKQLREALVMRPMEILNPKLSVALALSLLPPPVRSAVNRLANRLRATPESKQIIDDYQ